MYHVYAMNPARSPNGGSALAIVPQAWFIHNGSGITRVMADGIHFPPVPFKPTENCLRPIFITPENPTTHGRDPLSDWSRVPAAHLGWQSRARSGPLLSTGYLFEL
jgi:hypothetical protein